MKIDNPKDQKELDNHANQLNPDHVEYHHSREEPSVSIDDDDDSFHDWVDDWADDCYMSDFD